MPRVAGIFATKTHHFLTRTSTQHVPAKRSTATFSWLRVSLSPQRTRQCMSGNAVKQGTELATGDVDPEGNSSIVPALKRG